MKRQIIFTDLDGTLLDEVSYSCDQAQAALKLIAQSGTPLIFCSSKTHSEIERLRSRLHNAHPFITENGAGIFIPHGNLSFEFYSINSGGYDVILPGVPCAEIGKSFVRLRC